MNKPYLLLILFLLVLGGCTAPAVTPTVETATPAPSLTLVSPTATAPIQPTVAPSPTVAEAPIEEIIAYEMKGSFDFFWEQANTEDGSAGYGLIRDRYPGSEGIASIASVGYGLTAYAVGVEKGYIPFEEGYERASKTMDTLLNMDREHGFFFHFVVMNSGKRAWESEVSSIDTAILMMGVLTAGEYFGGDVAIKSAQLYDAVDWPWFVDPERNMFYMAYRPGKGFEGHWDFYAEQLMLYVLAAGSDTYPTDDGPYYAFTRQYGKYGDGEPFIHSWFGSIFTYQFSHAWLDFRGRTDREGVDWFQNSVDASLAQVNFAKDMDEKYTTLGPNAWGLTACDGPGGYNGRYGAPPSGFNNDQHYIDDTVAPAGAIGSIIFVPDDAQRAMQYYYSLEQLKGRYGFMDAFNLSEEWFDSDVIGIDKGITLLMLANYENDLVYKTSMKNKTLLQGLERLQIVETTGQD